MSAEQRSHDLALAYINYKLNIEIRDTDADHDKDSFFDMYKEAYDSFFGMITDGQ